jgi:hypothetical protein
MRAAGAAYVRKARNRTNAWPVIMYFFAIPAGLAGAPGADFFNEFKRITQISRR